MKQSIFISKSVYESGEVPSSEGGRNASPFVLGRSRIDAFGNELLSSEEIVEVLLVGGDLIDGGEKISESEEEIDGRLEGPLTTKGSEASKGIDGS